jgi:hypothetical protein
MTIGEPEDDYNPPLPEDDESGEPLAPEAFRCGFSCAASGLIRRRIVIELNFGFVGCGWRELEDVGGCPQDNPLSVL